MALTPYCTNDEVRAVLGVSISEIRDEVLDLPVYEMGLRRELTKLSLSLPAAFSTVNSIASVSRTAVQSALYDAVKMFSVYAVARQSGAPLALSAPKSLNDDKSGFSRYADSPYKDVLERIEQMYQHTRQDLLTALSEYQGATASARALPGALAVSSRTYDPVVGS
jgi:hypothetical protein